MLCRRHIKYAKAVLFPDRNRFCPQGNRFGSAKNTYLETAFLSHTGNGGIRGF